MDEENGARGSALRAFLRRPLSAHMRKLRGLDPARLLGLGLLAFLVAVRGWDPIPMQVLRLKVFDYYQILNPRPITTQPVAIVDIDEKTLDEFGQWPWPRDLVAKLVEQLSAYGVVVSGFDIVFAEPDRLSAPLLADSLPGLDETIRDRLRQLPSNDQILAEALAKSRVVLGQSGHPDAATGTGRPIHTAPIALLGEDPRPHLFRFAGLVRNVGDLEAATPGRGMFNLVSERDGLVRRVPAIVLVENVMLPTLSLEMLRLATGQSAYTIKTDEAGVRAIILAGVEIPTDSHARVWVKYSPRDPDKYVSAADVLAGRAAPEKLAGKLALIGTSAVGLLDVKSTPLHASIPGVEVHANILETVLTQSFIVRPNYALGAEVVLLLLVGAFMIVVVPSLGALFALITGAVITATLTALSWYFFVAQGLLIDVSYAVLAGGAVYLSLVFFNYLREEQRRRQVRNAFGQYLSPELVDQLAGDPDRLVLGGETRTMSFLFCDVRGFTTISEHYKSDPQGLTRLINRFLTPLTDAILETHGTIDKYMGDAIMAFWNAPLEETRHAARACRAALDMLDRLAKLNEALAQEAAEKGEMAIALQIGIGINSGSCVVGNMGSRQRFDYTVLGDAVNLASRLEGQSKTYAVTVVVGDETAKLVGDDLALLELDRIRVKGKAEPERIFALLGGADLRETAAFKTLRDHNAQFLDHYRGQRWQTALDAITACRAVASKFGLDAAYDMHAVRCAAFAENPPPQDWDGVYVAETK